MPLWNTERKLHDDDEILIRVIPVDLLYDFWIALA